LEVATRTLTFDGLTDRYLDVTCHDPTGNDGFDLIGGELASRLSTQSEAASEAVQRVLAKWRRFWGQLPRQLLTREQVVGLFAELWFLDVWLTPAVGVAQAVARWRGPFGARHDFESDGESVEVKGTTSTRGPIHRINGIEQLAPPQNGALFFFSLRMREEIGATNTLPLLVTTCRMQCTSDDVALSKFEAALAQSGYLSAHEEEYARLRFRVIKEELFAVRDDFPRLTPAQLLGGVPAGLEQVVYEVNLGGFRHLLVARNAMEAPSILRPE
jgi:hypothetical protein